MVANVVSIFVLLAVVFVDVGAECGLRPKAIDDEISEVTRKPMYPFLKNEVVYFCKWYKKLEKFVARAARNPRNIDLRNFVCNEGHLLALKNRSLSLLVLVLRYSVEILKLNRDDENINKNILDLIREP